MGWLYNKGLAKLSVFPYNNFFPDGTPMEATGGCNNIHTNGLFSLECYLRQLRRCVQTKYRNEQQWASFMETLRDIGTKIYWTFNFMLSTNHF
ncbi:MAG: hypothetical protein VCF25_12060 [Candidatus Poribacteria bacterium]|nr:hypothetical protein [Candidatus Poribacteria bacterium]